MNSVIHSLHGLLVVFEKENIWTFDGKGELLISIMSSLAQEESRSISENVTWGQRRRMAEGKVSLPYAKFLGYKKGENGLPEIVPEEAEVVRLIYKLFIDGMTPYYIAKELTRREIPTPGGKKIWVGRTIALHTFSANTTEYFSCHHVKFSFKCYLFGKFKFFL